MRKLALASLLALSTLGLRAGGEYDNFHFGFRGGIGWSPAKEYGGIGSETPGVGTVGSAKMQLAPTIGLQGQWAMVPGVFSMGLIADFIRPIHKEAGTEGSPITQDMIRGEMRFVFAGRGNTNEGMGWFVAPTYSKIRTRTNDDSIPSLAEGKAGGALGLNKVSFDERYITYWEAALYYTPQLSSGTTAGGLTLELRVGWLF
mgnify:FL=1